jgi:hypothetical protein
MIAKGVKLGDSRTDRLTEWGGLDMPIEFGGVFFLQYIDNPN